MLNIFAFSIIITSLAIIIVIMYKKLPLLEGIKINEIQEGKRKKYKILEMRLQRKIQHFFNKKSIQHIRNTAHNTRKKIKLFYKNIKHKKNDYIGAQKEIAPELVPTSSPLEHAERLFKEEKLDEAEQTAINYVKANPKSLNAYKLLCQIYFEKRNFAHAEATQEHVIKLAQRLKLAKAIDYIDLANIKLILQKAREALQEAIKAVRLEPQNPKVLHFLVKTCITCKQKKLAWKYYLKLKKVNKDNQALDDLIEELKKL